MKIKREVRIEEDELTAIIKEVVSSRTGLNFDEIIFRTGVRGDYDKGNAVEFVREVICIGY